MRRLLSAALVAGAVLVVSAIAVKAADKGGPAPLPPEMEPVAAPIKPVCWGGVSVGKTITSSAFDAGLGGKIALSAEGLQAGVEAGCDLYLQHVIVGAMGRYEMLDINERSAFGNVGADVQWMFALRAGIKINPGSVVYGLVGYQGVELSYPGINVNTEGLVYGVGLELDVAYPNLAVFAEWTRAELDRQNVGGINIDPTTDTLRAGVRYRFNFGN